MKKTHVYMSAQLVILYIHVFLQIKLLPCVFSKFLHHASIYNKPLEK